MFLCASIAMHGSSLSTTTITPIISIMMRLTPTVITLVPMPTTVTSIADVSTITTSLTTTMAVALTQVAMSITTLLLQNPMAITHQRRSLTRISTMLFQTVEATTRVMIQRLCATTQTEEVQTLVLKASVRTTDVRTTIHRHVLHAVRMHRTLAAEL